MPKISYRCSHCHGKKVTAFWCGVCDRVTGSYKCQHNHWYELFFLTIKSYIRIFINILKILRDSWREFLGVIKYYNKLEKILNQWTEKDK